MHKTLQHGYMAEEKFILECLERNIQISRTVFNVETYDFVVRTKNGFRSIQVKKSWIDERNRNVVNLRSSSNHKFRYYVIVPEMKFFYRFAEDPEPTPNAE